MIKERIYCKECNKQTKYVIDNFSRYHLSNHNLTIKEYYDKHHKKSVNEGKCKKCQKNTMFLSFNRGYCDFCSTTCYNYFQKHDDEFKKDFKEKIKVIDKEKAKTKRKETCKKVYGSEYASSSKLVRLKVENTNIKKYGNSHTLSLSECKNNREKSLRDNIVEITKKRRIYLDNEYNMEIAKKKRIETCLRKYGVESVLKLDEVWAKIRIRNYKSRKWTDPATLNGIDKYYYDVHKETKKNRKKLFELWDGNCYYFRNKLNNIKNNRFQFTIDHKISIINGFRDGIPPDKIGSLENICICSKIVNCVKNHMNEREFLVSKRYQKIRNNLLPVTDRKIDFNCKIKTKEGNSDFYGIRRIKDVQTYLVTLENGYNVECTEFHRFNVCGIDLTIRDIIVGEQQLETDIGCSTVLSIKKNNKQDVYDILSVKNGESTYYTNGINSHNCSFTGSTITLIDGDIIAGLKTTEPVFMIDEGYVVWRKPESKRMYAFGVDVGQGTSSDYSVINIFDITDFIINGKYEQVAVYRRNDITVFDFEAQILKLAAVWNDALVIVENNGLGLGSVLVKQLYFEDGYENAYFDAPSGEYGINANKKTKALALTYFKADVEEKRMKIVSKEMATELSYFEEQKDGIFAARKGNNFHDDLVSSAYWISYMLRQPWAEERIQWFLEQIGKGSINKNNKELQDQNIADAFLSQMFGNNPQSDFDRELWLDD